MGFRLSKDVGPSIISSLVLAGLAGGLAILDSLPFPESHQPSAVNISQLRAASLAPAPALPALRAEAELHLGPSSDRAAAGGCGATITDLAIGTSGVVTSPQAPSIHTRAKLPKIRLYSEDCFSLKPVFG